MELNPLVALGQCWISADSVSLKSASPFVVGDLGSSLPR